MTISMISGCKFLTDSEVKMECNNSMDTPAKSEAGIFHSPCVFLLPYDERLSVFFLLMAI